MTTITKDLGCSLAEIARPVEEGGLPRWVIATQAVGWISRHFYQASDRFYRQTQGASPGLLKAVEYIVPTGRKLAEGIECIVIQKNGQMVMRPPMLPQLPCPDIPHTAVMRVLVYGTSQVSVMLNLGFKRIDEASNDFVRVGVI